MSTPIVECVPNISEGRDRAKIDEIVAAAAAVPGVQVLDVDPGSETNRTVITLVGAPGVIEEGAFRLIARAKDLIDMSRQTGAHARHGATDVCPFIPVAGVTMEDCIEIAKQLGARVGDELGIPVYLYDRAAQREDRRSLAAVRKGEYEALPQKMKDPAFAPDFGPQEFLPRTGVITIGAREFLIAYNINLNTRSVEQANDIAHELREKGRAVRVEQRTPYYSSGRLLRYQPGRGIWPSFTGEVFPSREDLDAHYRACHGTTLADELAFFDQDPEALEDAFVMKRGLFRECRAVGWMIPEYGRAQISINLTNFRITNMHDVTEAARTLAAERGITVTGSEVVGVVPHEAIHASGAFYLERQGSSRGIPPRDVVETAVQSLGLADIAPFDLDRSVLGLPTTEGTLTGLSTAALANEVSRDSVAPGGGSISALAGSLAAGLGSMVANITFSKRRYRKRRGLLEQIATEAQEIKDDLMRAVDLDTEAFNEVIAANRLPRETPEEQTVRAAAIEAGYKNATEVPLASARLCLRALQLCRRIAEKGLPAGITDAGVGALLARAGLEGSIYNVRINLGEIGDRTWVEQVLAECRQLREAASACADETDRLVEAEFRKVLETS
ncbi:MAG: glutamate formimidoyltransferase [Planctomycetota bacterium]|jgi:glutamate formiminotransferase/formiminotetrahydrofolate cyclodeaminase